MEESTGNVSSKLVTKSTVHSFEVKDRETFSAIVPLLISSGIHLKRVEVSPYNATNSNENNKQTQDQNVNLVVVKYATSRRRLN